MAATFVINPSKFDFLGGQLGVRVGLVLGKEDKVVWHLKEKFSF